MDDAQAAFERCAAGEPAVGFGEIYIQTGYDPSPAPEGKHLMSVFGQYAPYDLADGDWDSRRDDVAAPVHRPDHRFAPDFEDCADRLRGARPARHRVADRAHRRQHLPGRGDARTRCGRAGSPPARRSRASTSAAPPPIPAGSVIALNGRNAAAAVLADSGGGAAAAPCLRLRRRGGRDVGSLP